MNAKNVILLMIFCGLFISVACGGSAQSENPNTGNQAIAIQETEMALKVAELQLEQTKEAVRVTELMLEQPSEANKNSGNPESTSTTTLDSANIATPVNTTAGGILMPGETWYQDGFEIQIKNPSFIPECGGWIGFEMTLINNTGSELVVSVKGVDFDVSDDTGKSYSDIWFTNGKASESCYKGKFKDFKVNAMKPADRLDFALRILGELPQSASQVIVTVYKAGRIQNAKWLINIPR